MRETLTMICLTAALLVAGPAQATPGSHLVTGTVQLETGAWLGIEAQEAVPVAPAGLAWLANDTLPRPSIQIALDCLVVTWQMTVYPIPPYLPYHLVETSGTGSDGDAYFITVYDFVNAPIGFGDRAIVSKSPGAGNCGAAAEQGAQVAAGQITVLP